MPTAHTTVLFRSGRYRCPQGHWVNSPRCGPSCTHMGQHWCPGCHGHYAPVLLLSNTATSTADTVSRASSSYWASTVSEARAELEDALDNAPLTPVIEPRHEGEWPMAPPSLDLLPRRRYGRGRAGAERGNDFLAHLAAGGSYIDRRHFPPRGGWEHQWVYVQMPNYASNNRWYILGLRIESETSATVIWGEYYQRETHAAQRWAVLQKHGVEFTDIYKDLASESRV